MRRPLCVSAFAILFTVLASLQVCAQYDDDNAGRLSIKLGLYRPSGSELRSDIGSTWKVFGISYATKLDESGKPKSCIGIEQASASKDLFRGRLTSLQYSWLWHKRASARGPYYGMGAGIFMAKKELESTFYALGEKQSGTKLGWSFVGGCDFGEYWFAELRYTMVGKIASDINFSGLTLYAGARGIF